MANRLNQYYYVIIDVNVCWRYFKINYAININSKGHAGLKGYSLTQNNCLSVSFVPPASY